MFYKKFNHFWLGFMRETYRFRFDWHNNNNSLYGLKSKLSVIYVVSDPAPASMAIIFLIETGGTYMWVPSLKRDGFLSNSRKSFIQHVKNVHKMI